MGVGVLEIEILNRKREITLEKQRCEGHENWF